MNRADLLLGLVAALVTILGYIAGLVRKIRRTLRAWEQHQAEHAQLLQLAHWHDRGRVIPLTPEPARPHRHRAAGGPPW